MARKGFMCVETTFVPRSVCFSLQSTADVENGSIVGKGDLVTGETSVYVATDDYSNGMYLVVNPATNYEVHKLVDLNEENFINPADIAFKTYRLEKDYVFKVYNIDGELAEGDFVKFEGGKYVKDEAADGVLKVVRVEEQGFPFCVGSAGIPTGEYGYAIGEVSKKYSIQVMK